MKFGQFEIDTFVEQEFRLDGGSMFGVIPRMMWQKMIPPDENNLIPMRTNLFVLTAHGKKMIFDAGLGDSLSKREQRIYGTDGVSSMESGLASLGLSVDSIDYVILTHLHTDHAGGAVRLDDGQFVPRFPNATIIADKTEWQVAMNPNERTAAVYVPERYQALKDSGRLELIDGNTELFSGIRAVHTGGHTEGHFGLEMESDGQKVFYYADIFCMAAHMRVPFVPATDLYPLETMEAKRKALPKIMADNVVVAFDHDMTMPFARVSEVDGKIIVQPVVV
ncbi:MAG: MBL fold metallo-hydrolase [candidate division Zixibacteria bacterium]|nr:MBL fold metallo-hydrolase [candidate division Zixibacteria bacterium]